ncbi:MAG: apolipoprotein N-acyltransferase [Candidatus Rokuibacteriota bacterium]
MATSWRPSRRDLSLAALAGGALVLAFPSADLGLLSFVALVPWLARIPDVTPRTAALGGLVAGLAFYLGSLWWIAGTMVRYGDVPSAFAIPVAAAILLLLALYLSLFTATFAAALAWVRPTTGPGFVLVAATLWVALEYGRAHLLSGFPWNLLGYSQYRNTALLPVVTVTGVYGLSFLVVAVNAALAWACRHGRHWRDVGGTAALVAGLMVLALLPGESVPGVAPGPSPTTVALVQGNVAQELKWDPARQLETLVAYQRLSLTAALERRPALIVWPETAVPFSLEDPRRREPVLAVARAVQTPLLVGAPHGDRTTGRVFNSAFLVDATGAVADRYDKVHLVPFGEYVPLRRLLAFADWFVSGGIGEFTPGAAREGPRLPGGPVWRPAGGARSRAR